MSFKSIILPVLVLLIVLFIWFNQNLFRNHRTELPVSIRYANLEEDRVITRVEPGEIFLVVEGKGLDIWQFSRSAHYIEIDAASLDIGSNEVTLSENNLIISDPQYRAILDFSLNTTVFLDIDRSTITQIPVTIRYMTINDEYSFTQRNAVAQPKTVEVVGPSSVIEKITEVTTVPLSVDDISEANKVTAELEIPEGINGIKPDIVTIVLESPEIITRTIPLIRIEYPTDKLSMIIPNTVTVKIEGLADRVQELRASMITAYISIPEDYEYDFAPISFRLPDGVKLLEYTPQRVQVYHNRE